MFSAIGESAAEEDSIIRIATHLLAILPLAYIGCKAYIENKNNALSKLAYIFIVILIISLLMFFDIIMVENLILAIYAAYALVSLLFNEDKTIGKIMRGIFIAIYLFFGNLIISATLAVESEAINMFAINTTILLILSTVTFITTRKYKFDNETIILICTLIIGATPLIAIGLNIDIQDYRYNWEVISNLSRNIGYGISALMAILGVSYIRVGYKKLKFTTTLLGIFIIIYEILSTFLSMDIDFIPKAIIFLICGAAFIAGAIYFKKLTGGVQNEQ